MRKTCAQTAYNNEHNFVDTIVSNAAVCTNKGFYAVFTSNFPTLVHTINTHFISVKTVVVHTFHMAYNNLNQVYKLFINIMHSGELS